MPGAGDQGKGELGSSPAGRLPVVARLALAGRRRQPYRGRLGPTIGKGLPRGPFFIRS
jgi:hypothetical protein